MFCPNCGTQNPEVAQTCSKCNFALKGVVAPKFKGTMLMMNQPAVPSATPGAPAAPPPAAPVQAAPHAPAASAPQRASTPGAAPGMPSKLKGTMVGVAPMALPGQSGQAPVSVPSAGFQRGSNVPPTAPMPPQGGHTDSGGFAPSVPQQGVNPLGGTVAADASGFGAFGPPQGGPPQGPYGAQPGFPGAAMPMAPPQQAYSPQYGAPPAGMPPPGQQPVPMPYDPSGYGAQGQSPYGAPQGQYGAPQGQYGTPQGQYGAPQGQYGAPQGQYGAPQGQYGAQQNPYGNPAQYGAPPQPYGQAPGGQYGPPGMMAAPTASGGAATGPTRRNPLMTMLLPFAVIFGASFMGGLLGRLVNAMVGNLFSLVVLGGAVWLIIVGIQMVSEVKAVTRNEGFAWWPMFVPFYGMYWAWFLVPQEVMRAKQTVGAQEPVRSILLYIFFWHYALAADLNDMVR